MHAGAPRWPRSAPIDAMCAMHAMYTITIRLQCSTSVWHPFASFTSVSGQCTSASTWAVIGVAMARCMRRLRRARRRSDAHAAVQPGRSSAAVCSSDSAHAPHILSSYIESTHIPHTAFHDPRNMSRTSQPLASQEHARYMWYDSGAGARAPTLLNPGGGTRPSARGIYTASATADFTRLTPL